MISPEIDQNSLDAFEDTARDPDSLADIQVRAGCRLKTRGNDRLDGGNFAVLYRQWNSAAADDSDHSRSHKYRQALLNVELAKDISWEQRGAYLSQSCTPMLPYLVGREKDLVALARKQ
jgi:hypothetical protein